MKMPQGYCDEGGDSVKRFSRSSGGDVTLAVVVSTPIHTERPTPKRSKITVHMDKCNMLGKSQHSFCEEILARLERLQTSSRFVSQEAHVQRQCT